MRTAVTLAVGLAVALVCVAMAAADADVELRNNQLHVTVRALANADGIHGMIIEGFKVPAGPESWRVRQDRFGRPAFVENDADCFGNVLFNDVVCTGPRGSAVVTGGDSADAVVFSEFPGGQEQSTSNVGIRFVSRLSYSVKLPDSAVACLTSAGRPRVEIPAAVNLGAGNDILAVVAMGPCNDAGAPSSFGLWPSGSFLARLDVQGGLGEDSMMGGPAADTMAGGNDDDTVEGAGGNDTLSGGVGADELVGGPGRDSLAGDGDADRLFASDGGGYDDIACGSGVDSAAGDLADFFVPTRPATTPPTFTNIRNTANASDCENINISASDDGPPGHAVGRTLKRTSDGRGTIRVACPRDARVSCRGTLTVRLGRAYGLVLARARYAAARGKQTAVRVALGSARPGARVFVHTVEQGVSKKGPRYSQRLLLVR